EARNYALLALFAAAASYCLWRATSTTRGDARETANHERRMPGHRPRATDHGRPKTGNARRELVASADGRWSAGPRAPPVPGPWSASVVAAALMFYPPCLGALVSLFPAVHGALMGRDRRRFGLALLGGGLLYAPWRAGLIGQLYRLWRQPDFWAGTIDAWS